jgi:hypothetical protein
MAVQFKQDPELVQLFKHVPKKIIAYYRKMWGFYAKGDWKKARKGLGKIIKRRRDGPSLFLLEVMKDLGEVPKKWKGIREVN